MGEVAPRSKTALAFFLSFPQPCLLDRGGETCCCFSFCHSRRGICLLNSYERGAVFVLSWILRLPSISGSDLTVSTGKPGLEQKHRWCKGKSNSLRSHSIEEWLHITQSLHITVSVRLLYFAILRAAPELVSTSLPSSTPRVARIRSAISRISLLFPFMMMTSRQ